MEPGKDVSLDEFHEWYGNEHIPLRLESLPEFRSAARYKVTGAVFPTNAVSTSEVKAPGWAAMYTISSNAIFADRAYTRLRDERSAREADIFARIAVVDRRAYRLVYDSDLDARIHSPARHNLRPQTKDEIERESRYVVAHGVETDDAQEYAKWFDEEHAFLLSKVPGWTRSRRFELVDNGVVGHAADKQGRDAKEVPKFLAVHEYTNDQPESTQEYKAACDTEWRARAMGPNGERIVKRERKTMQLFRAYDPISAMQEK
ncbi:uncharacterized protein PSFLO_00998 [Pseudozyma flocculosa]|nr:uncharacterized protein PSFLO_00998 [Pseudozyma flocculosa]